ncbi:MAG: hypothetical protein OCD01_04175 [Fibrobacterales bacterium]
MSSKNDSKSPYTRPSSKVPDQPEACYDLIIDEITAQPTNALHIPSMRIDTYLFEVEELGKTALNHLKALKTFGFSKETAHKAIMQSRAAQHADILFKQKLRTETTDRDLWTQRAPEAKELRSKMVKILKLVCMKEPRHIKRIISFNKSKAMDGVLKDLTDLALFGRALPLEDSPVIFDTHIWDEADALITELRDLKKLAIVERSRATNYKTIRDQCISLLRATEVEIRNWIDVAFQDSPEVRKEFNSPYARQQYLKKKRLKTVGVDGKERLA